MVKWQPCIFLCILREDTGATLFKENTLLSLFETGIRDEVLI